VRVVNALKVHGTDLVATRLPAPLPIAHAEVDRASWHAAASAVRAAGGRLVSLWAGPAPGGMAAHVALAAADGLWWLTLPPALADGGFPDLTDVFPNAARLQRAARDLSGLGADGAADTRPWLDHGLWGDGGAPLRRPPGPTSGADPVATLPADVDFVTVDGDGVHEIAVGPVHAGTIEPGHFRFSVVGEKVLRLEQRLGYKHKGIERRFTELPALDAHRLAGRVSGDSTVAYAWACCMALESACGHVVDARAQSLRALLLERERVANHLGDLGALGNDAALAFAQAQFSRLREDWQRLSMQVFGHRLLMDVVVPGGVAVDPPAEALAEMAAQCERIAREAATLRAILDDHAGLQDRFRTTGRVTPALAAQLGVTGLAGRASAQAFDLRCDHAFTPYDRLQVRKVVHEGGDVAARVAVRFDELAESLRLIRLLCAGLPAPAVAPSAPSAPTPPAVPAAGDARGAGWVEGWRGPVLVALELADGAVRRCHAADPSWHNWPALEHAVIGNIVPDFPLINKSFNLSYSGHDL
jgi:Ni,Fe-hydrogenase III large subunit